MGLFGKVKDAAFQAAQAGMEKALAAVPGAATAAAAGPAVPEPQPIIDLLMSENASSWGTIP